MQKHNAGREDPITYETDKQCYSKNPLAARHKTQPRYVTRRVKKDMGIKVLDSNEKSYHKRNLKWPLHNQHTLLQDDTDPHPSYQQSWHFAFSIRIW